MATITPNFKLKNPKAEVSTLIYLKLYYNKERFVYSTGLSISPRLWDNDNDRTYQKNTAPDGLIMTKEDLRLVAIIDNELNRYKTETARIFNYFTYQAIQPTNELIKAEYDKVFKPDTPEKKLKEPEKLNLNQYIEQFIQDIKTGKRTTENGTRYTTGTIKNYLGFQSQFNEYQLDPRDRPTATERKKRKDNDQPKEPKYRRKNIDFEDITIDFYDQYVSFFNQKNYSPNTTGRHIKALKVIMRAAAEDGLHENKDIERKKFKVITTEVHPVYLTQQEVESLYNLDLSDNKTLDIARDIFLIGCYTAQRFSDYSRINAKQIKEVKGGKVIELIQKKTGERVTIPVRPELETILKKYDYNPPHTHEQKANERIKLVCEKAEIKELIEIEEIKGGLKVTQSHLKHELIKTHTARRTGATLMFLAGIPSISIMKITGHKTEREFLKYIRITKEENANLLMNHPYFKGTNLKIAK
ncbi:MAG: phage integrase SAM-like domain-containing protein [Prolixibacteraceae bacterium]|nr:phage integrase SAM-like domain-containing protein [Prolixibacteraceae bacterium]